MMYMRQEAGMTDPFDLIAIVVILMLIAFILGMVAGVSLARPRVKS